MCVLLGHYVCGNLLCIYRKLIQILSIGGRLCDNSKLLDWCILGTAFFIEILTLQVTAVACSPLDSDVLLGNDQSIDELRSQ